MSKLSDTQIHRIELLLTLYYLFKFSDAKHPVSQLDICRYATNFGLKFDEENIAGNDIRRQRIKDTLVFLEELSTRYKDSFPFKISSTEKGKYFLEKRYNLSKGDIFNIIFSIENNRFIKEEVAKDLKEKVFKVFSSQHEKKELEKTLTQILSPNNKYSTYTTNVLGTLMNAIKKEKIVKLKRLNYEYDVSLKDYALKDNSKRYRVYTIKEYNGKLFAILIAISDGEIICEDIRSICITGQKKWVFADDLIKNRDLNRLFTANNIENKSLDTYMKEAKIPLNKNTRNISFSFKCLYLRMVETSFRDYFNQQLPFEIVENFKTEKTIKGTALKSSNKELTMKLTEVYKNSRQIIDEQYDVIVNLLINEDAFIEWILSNLGFAENITIYDETINRRLAKHYKNLANKFEKYL